MREADVAIRLRQPTQPDLIQRKLFTVHFHAYASPEYLKRFGTPRSHEDLDNHRLLVLGGSTVPTYLRSSRLADRRRPRRQGAAHAVAHHQQRARPAARLPARARHRDAARLSGRGERRTGAACSATSTTSPSMPSSSIRKNSNPLRASRCSATFWSRKRSSGISENLRFCVSESVAWLTCGHLRCSHARRGPYSSCAAGNRSLFLPGGDRGAASCSPLEGDCRLRSARL